jgi:NhaP-type Na+/H+ or K+/H+ antiporter
MARHRPAAAAHFVLSTDGEHVGPHSSPQIAGDDALSVTAWYLVIGGLLVAMALAGSVLKRLPLSASMFYLGLGFVLGPAVLGALEVSPLRDSAIVERITEAVVVISLFTTGLKLRVPLHEGRWALPVRLATASMVITIGCIALIAFYGLGLPLGAAVLLGAILAPTDPVLASDVQVADPFDRDRLRFGLTGEAGLNDGTAFPFVMLGLGLLGLHDLGAAGWRWWTIDLAWSVAGGLCVGAVLGTLVGRLVLHLRRKYREAVGLDEFLLIGLSYGTALLLHTYGFLAVLAAGIALRRVEMRDSGDRSTDEVRALTARGSGEESETDPEKAPAFMVHAVLMINERLERIAEVTVVVLIGALLAAASFSTSTLWFVATLLFLVRPTAVFFGLLGVRMTMLERGLVGWFGIRGAGSVYYLAYAIQHGIEEELAVQLTNITLMAVTASVLLHGISVTPLMNAYAARR